MNKKALAKLQPGTVVEVKWDDMPAPTKAMLLEKVDRDERGDVSVFLYHFDIEQADRHAVHTQIVRAVNRISVSDTNEQYLTIGLA